MGRIGPYCATDNTAYSPVFAGDMIGGTNLTLLNRALRTDGVILKPSFAAHRLDAFYYGELPPGQQHARAHEWSPSKPSPSSPCYLAEVWSAPTVPSRVNGTARTDRRANSMARLFPLNGQASAVDTAAGGRWWYSLLLSDLSGTEPASALLPHCSVSLLSAGVAYRIFAMPRLTQIACSRGNYKDRSTHSLLYSITPTVSSSVVFAQVATAP